MSQMTLNSVFNRYQIQVQVVVLLVKSGLQMLDEKLPRNKAVFPHLNDIAVVDGIAQLCKGHVQLVHSERRPTTCVLCKSSFYQCHFLKMKFCWSNKSILIWFWMKFGWIICTGTTRNIVYLVHGYIRPCHFRPFTPLNFFASFKIWPKWSCLFKNIKK